MPRSIARSRKRKYLGSNKYDQARKAKKVEDESSATRTSVTTGDENDKGQSSSKSKLKNILPESEEQLTDFNFIMSFKCLENLFQCLFCPECQSGSLSFMHKSKYGFRYKFELVCDNCSWKRMLENIFEEKKLGKGKISSLNLQTVMAFREIGCGYAKIKDFCSIMNMENAMAKKTYHNINATLCKAYSAVAKESVSKAALETRQSILKNEFEAGKVADCQVSVDGSWQRRGHSSLNGFTAIISKENGKVLDTEVLSKVCKGCQAWSKCKTSAKYVDWKANHLCQKNHEGSSGSMEGAGAVRIWERSLENKLRYTSYIGDGDTSSYAEVLASKPYGDVEIKKLECIGHVNKRMGARCRKLVDIHRGKKLSDGKPLSGKGRLTNKAINVLQNYYGIAIRENANNVYAMKKCVWAVLFHNSNIANLEERHKFCPRNIKSWCLYQQDKITGKNSYKIKLNLPLAVKNLLIPTFKDLSDGSLLEKCLHGQTQNANECFNALVWKRCPKAVFVSRKVLEMSVNSSVINFNDGFSGLAEVFQKLNVHIGVFTKNGFAKADRNRITRMNKKSTKEVKTRRKKLAHMKKGYLDKEREKEKVPAYAKGQH